MCVQQSNMFKKLAAKHILIYDVPHLAVTPLLYVSIRLVFEAKTCKELCCHDIHRIWLEVLGWFGKNKKFIWEVKYVGEW